MRTDSKIDKIPVNQYPTHFWISRVGGVRGKAGLEAGCGSPLDSSVGGSTGAGCVGLCCTRN